jgi:serine/threonine protein kinase
MLTENLKVKLTNFGFLKSDISKAKKCTTMLGAPNFQAPEMKSSQGYDGFSLDIF